MARENIKRAKTEVAETIAFDALAAIDQLGGLSRFTCPACHGAMREILEANPVRFRYSTGHAYTAANFTP